MRVNMQHRLGLNFGPPDPRDIKLKSILKSAVELPPTPEKYDVDKNMKITLPMNVLGNDTWGDCVIVARANQTLRFEYAEQQSILDITTNDCLKEYWFEQQESISIWWLKLLSKWFNIKYDNGLVYQDSIKLWRNLGWKLKTENYKICAYAAVPTFVNQDVKQAVHLLGGLQAGVSLPKSAMIQFERGEPWEVSTPLDMKFIGGHAIYVKAYDKDYLTCITWGKEQKITWEWWNNYSAQSYAIVDQKNLWMENSPINVTLLNAYLNAITGV